MDGIVSNVVNKVAINRVVLSPSLKRILIFLGVGLSVLSDCHCILALRVYHNKQFAICGSKR